MTAEHVYVPKHDAAPDRGGPAEAGCTRAGRPCAGCPGGPRIARVSTRRDHCAAHHRTRHLCRHPPPRSRSGRGCGIQAAIRPRHGAWGRHRVRPLGANAARVARGFPAARPRPRRRGPLARRSTRRDARQDRGLALCWDSTRVGDRSRAATRADLSPGRLGVDSWRSRRTGWRRHPSGIYLLTRRGSENDRVVPRYNPAMGMQQAPRRGRLFHLFWPVTSYVVTNVTVTLFWLVFFVFNRTVVIGRRNVGEERNTLLLSNHQSMLDSFLVGLAAFYPTSWLKPQLIPWNPAAAENFYKNPLLAWLADNWKCIWVREGRRDLHALHRMIQVLPHGVMTLFPEGTRSRDGAVGPGRPGAGLLILATRPRVIPVAIDG